MKHIGQFVNSEMCLRKVEISDSLSTLKCVLGKLKHIGQFVNSEMCLRKVEISDSLSTLKCVLGKLKQLDEMNSEIEKRKNCENGRRPSFISSVLSDWFNQPLARSLIGWNLKRCSWLKLFFWGRVENSVKSVFCDYFPK